MAYFAALKYGNTWLNNPTGGDAIEGWYAKNIPVDQILLDSPLLRNLQAGFTPERRVPMRLGSIYWPTGADRFAVGCFLASKRVVGEIFTADGGPSARPLLIGNNTEGDNQVILPKMYALEAVPLAYWGGFDLYMIVFVDERYYWRFRNWPPSFNSYMGVPRGAVSWDDLFGTAASVLQATFVTPTVGSQHHVCNLSSIIGNRKRHLGNAIALACEVVEAAAISVGRTVVADYRSGNYPLQHSDDYDAILLANSETFNRRAGYEAYKGVVRNADGDDEQLIFMRQWAMPNTVDVLFPQIHHLTGLPFSDFYGVSVNLPNIATDIFEGPMAGVPGWTHTIQDSFPAIRKVTIDGTDEVANATELQDLAENIAANYYQHFIHAVDIVYNGVCQVAPCGAYDTIEWHLSHRDAYTRVRSAPLNGGDYWFTHHGKASDSQYPGIDGPMHGLVIGWLDEPLDPGSFASISVKGFVNRHVEVEDELNKVDQTLPEGTKIIACMDRQLGVFSQPSGDIENPVRFQTPRYVVIGYRCGPADVDEPTPEPR